VNVISPLLLSVYGEPRHFHLLHYGNGDGEFVVVVSSSTTMVLILFLLLRWVRIVLILIFSSLIEHGLDMVKKEDYPPNEPIIDHRVA
jgi:uncharacterized membrane protein